MKTILIFLVAVLFLACGNKSAVEKPAKFISEAKMVDVIYDLYVLQAIKSVNPNILEQKKITPTSYIYKKYNIDSLQFAQNDRYYATNLELYEKMYDKVNERILQNKKLADSIKIDITKIKEKK